MTGRTSIESQMPCRYSNFLSEGNSGNRSSDTMWQRWCRVQDTCEVRSRCKLFSCWTTCLGCCPDWVNTATTVGTHGISNAIVARLRDRLAVEGIERSLCVTGESWLIWRSSINIDSFENTFPTSTCATIGAGVDKLAVISKAMPKPRAPHSSVEISENG